MSFIVVDVEANGPCAGLFSMLEIGAVVVGKENDPNHGFHRKLRPINNMFKDSAYSVLGYSHRDALYFDNPATTMMAFNEWLLLNNKKGRPIFVSDNPAFDWQFVNYYFWKYLEKNPFGFSARRIGDFAAGLASDFYQASKWKQLRRTKHTHNPLDDARGNAEALTQLMQQCVDR